MRDVQMVRTYQGLYRVLNHDGAWSPEATERYRSSDCNGLRWQYKRRPAKRPFDLSALNDLPGLLYLSSSVRDAADSGVEALVDLQWLDLFTRSQEPVDLSRLTGLKTANLDDRPGLHGLPPSLHEVSLAYSQRPDLSWASGLVNVRGVKVEALGQRMVLTGLSRHDHLTVLWVDEALVETADVLDLPALERGTFTASEPGRGTFDCAVFAGCQSLRWLTVRGPRALVNVDAVLALPQLEWFAIIGGDQPRDEHPLLRYVEWSGGRGH